MEIKIPALSLGERVPDGGGQVRGSFSAPSDFDGTLVLWSSLEAARVIPMRLMPTAHCLVLYSGSSNILCSGTTTTIPVSVT